MKNLTLLFLLVISFIIPSQLEAQTFTLASSTNTTVDLDSIQTSVEIADKAYEGGYSKSGSIWIKRVSSKSGEPYKAYLGFRLKDKFFEGKSIWTTKSRDKYWFFVINPKTGYPSRKYLNVTD